MELVYVKKNKNDLSPKNQDIGSYITTSMYLQLFIECLFYAVLHIYFINPPKTCAK